MFQEKNIPYYQIMDAFLTEYSRASQAWDAFLQITDDMERRTAIAKVAPDAAKWLENQTQEEMVGLLKTLAIASSVAAAVVEGMRISHQ